MDILTPAVTPKINWRNAIFLSLTPLIALVATPFYVHGHGLPLAIIAFFLFSSAATSLSITAGYHRLLSHRSYEARKWVKLLYLIFGATAFQGSALQWSADHRKHHRLVDSDGDPHNIHRGLLWAHVGWLFFEEDPRFPSHYPYDLKQDSLVAWQDRYYVPIALTAGFAMPALFGWAIGDFWGGLLFGGVWRVVFTNHCTFLINSLAHKVGSRPYNDKQTARDSLLMAFLAFGEGFHNYHHAFASDYRNGIKWYHWDPTKWLIGMQASIGMAYRLKRVPASDILRVRLQNEHRRMLMRGAPADRILALKQKVEDAQAQWRVLREDYFALKRNMEVRSREHLRNLKAELKVARLEFKLAWAQWAVYRRAVATVQA